MEAIQMVLMCIEIGLNQPNGANSKRNFFLNQVSSERFHKQTELQDRLQYDIISQPGRAWRTRAWHFSVLKCTFSWATLTKVD